MDSWLQPSHLCGRTSSFLGEVYSDELALHPFTTSVVDSAYVSSYDQVALRYTINTLLGLQRAGDPSVAAKTARLRALHADTMTPGDRGLLLVLLAEAGGEGLADELAAAREGVARAGAARLDLQELSWLLWGSCRALRAGVGDAEELLLELRAALAALEGPAALARHTHAAGRSDLVSFGSTVYYLRALHELSLALGDGKARARFDRGVQAALGFQGPNGEWPWMISVRRAQALDAYPLYSVHQLAMAMLFLLPALDDGVVGGVAESIRRSYRWVAGENELGFVFAQENPFIVFRSLERDERLPKLRRFARSTSNSVLRSSRGSVEAGRTRINREWRSYEGGWLLYTCTGRDDALVL
jgi:hypothetical protein